MLSSICYLNEQGKRKNIEDNLFPAPGYAGLNDRVFLVCDGVGGESKGEEASRIVCETMGALLSSKPADLLDTIAFRDAASAAIEAMNVYAETYTQAYRMSTTLTAACIGAKGVWIAWCGDSRVYHIRHGKVLWQTKDHSLVQQLIENNEITLEDAKHHPRKNVILRSVTANSPTPTIDTHFINDLREGDYLLLCTDGLLEHVDEASMEDILQPGNNEKDKAKLFLAQCEGRTNDNFSMYLLQFSGKEPAKFTQAPPVISGSKKQMGSKDKFPGSMVGGVIVAIVLLCFAYWFIKRKSSSDLSNPENLSNFDKNATSGSSNTSGAISIPVLPPKDSQNLEMESEPQKKPVKAGEIVKPDTANKVPVKEKERLKPVAKAVMPPSDSVPD